ncbi:MAG: tRNA (N6-threonylcarbamoyladenosine(37)-N6)-methyltransferase TrmO [Desulfobacteraceae bacterium]|nr:tRNA (N6-threonylcarbamoyladenosine(37)-N6)-methyltransferase TrmO [Desulfobacteraceae bacterium]
MEDKIIRPIGTIHSPFTNKEACPIQPMYSKDTQGSVEVFAEYEQGLKDIDMFSHIYLFYLFDRAGEIKMVRPTFLDDEPHGIFASRHPCRPNGIGISIVKLIFRNANVLEIEGIDVLDNTPLIDIKPYVPKFDVFSEASDGWVGSKPWRPKPRGRE